MSHQKTVLIIDDEEDLRDTVGYKFKSAGFEVVTAIDGVDGLEKLKDVSPDLIILDMNMPRMNGLEFYQKIKGPDDKPKYPVLILTARANMEQLFHDLDVDGFLAKPFELDELLSVAGQIMKRASGIVKMEAGSGNLRSRKIFLVEADSEVLEKLALGFLDCGYSVQTARSGASGLKRINTDVPDVALISMQLQDISGDVMVGKLFRMNASKDLKVVLYSSREADMDKTVITSTITRKEGVDKFVPSNDISDLLPAIEALF